MQIRNTVRRGRYDLLEFASVFVCFHLCCDITDMHPCLSLSVQHRGGTYIYREMIAATGPVNLELCRHHQCQHHKMDWLLQTQHPGAKKPISMYYDGGGGGRAGCTWRWENASQRSHVGLVTSFLKFSTFLKVTAPVGAHKEPLVVGWLWHGSVQQAFLRIPFWLSLAFEHQQLHSLLPNQRSPRKPLKRQGGLKGAPECFWLKQIREKGLINFHNTAEVQRWPKVWYWRSFKYSNQEFQCRKRSSREKELLQNTSDLRLKHQFLFGYCRTLNSSGKHPPYQSSMTAFPPGLEAELI